MNVLIQLLFNNALSLYLNVHCTMYISTLYIMVFFIIDFIYV